jgi:hypothetical protein
LLLSIRHTRGHISDTSAVRATHRDVSRRLPTRADRANANDRATKTLRRAIAQLAAERSFLLADLERLFHGHGLASNEPWFVQVIEPNLAGATATAEHWHELLTSR